MYRYVIVAMCTCVAKIINYENSSYCCKCLLVSHFNLDNSYIIHYLKQLSLPLGKSSVTSEFTTSFTEGKTS